MKVGDDEDKVGIDVEGGEDDVEDADEDAVKQLFPSFCPCHGAKRISMTISHKSSVDFSHQRWGGQCQRC